MEYPHHTRADAIGPTVDTNLEQAIPLYRQEDFQIQAAKAPPISLAMKARPLTHRVNHQMSAAPAVVISRVSNQNPANAGQGDYTSIWSVSDPYGPKRSPLNGLGAVGGGLLMPAMVGIGIGFLLYQYR